MGAWYVEDTIDGKYTKTQVIDLFKEKVSHSLAEYGNSYSGDWGMKDSIKVEYFKTFNNLEEAQEYVSSNAGKWDDALAVRYKKHKKKLVKPKYLKSLEKKIADSSQKIKSLTRIAEEQVRSKSFVGCRSCKSRLNTDMLTYGTTCPVCRGTLMSKMYVNKINSLEKKIEQMRERIQDCYKEECVGEHWYLGAWCSS